jgi:hypothetical protein
VNWRRVSRPISLGGLGTHDLERTGLTYAYAGSATYENQAWSGLDLQFTMEERSLFFASTTMTVGEWLDRQILGRTAR